MKGIYKTILDSSMLSIALTSTLWFSYIFLRISMNAYNTFYIIERNLLVSGTEFVLCAVVSGYLIHKIYKRIRKVDVNE